jgi:hypothetical protein
MLATTIHKSNTTPHHQSRATTNTPDPNGPKAGTHPTHDKTHARQDRGLVVSKPNSVSGNPEQRRYPQPLSHVCCRTRPPPTTGEGPSNESPGKRGDPTICGAGPGLVVLLRKEVIQPHLPVRLPCYDFVPIADPTFDGSLPQGVRPPASGVTDFHDVTGGVYKARERIHRSVADLRLLATPTSRGRVADPDPN